MVHLILVIDDDPDVWTTLALRLESFGLKMISAKDGTQGLQKAKDLGPDLILLDIGLKDEDGIDVLKKFKTDSSEMIRQIPILMLTGKEEHEKESLKIGAVGYVTKPFDLFLLKETIFKFLPKKRKI